MYGLRKKGKLSHFFHLKIIVISVSREKISLIHRRVIVMETQGYIIFLLIKQPKYAECMLRIRCNDALNFYMEGTGSVIIKIRNLFIVAYTL